LSSFIFTGVIGFPIASEILALKESWVAAVISLSFRVRKVGTWMTWPFYFNNFAVMAGPMSNDWPRHLPNFSLFKKLDYWPNALSYFSFGSRNWALVTFDRLTTFIRRVNSLAYLIKFKDIVRDNMSF